jgi:hypothetical protein
MTALGTFSAAPPTDVAGGPSRNAGVRHGVAFGLEIAGTFQGPGLWTGEENGVPRRVSLEMIPAAALERSRADCGWETLRRIRVDDDGRMLILDGHLEHGYRVHADGFGSYLISRDGRRVLLAPEPVEAWRWQRLLTAQVLPIASLLQGLELFHASAVELDGHGLAFTGGSGAGKSTLAAHLMLAGATFVCDDALAVEGTGGEVLAHPGPALMNLRDSTAELLSADERANLGTRLGCDEAGARLLVRRAAAALPLEAIYVLRRSAGWTGGVRLRRLSPPAPEVLLGAGFGTVIRTSHRLIRRLDVCALLAARTAVFAIEAPAQAPPKALAAAVLRQVRQGEP